MGCIATGTTVEETKLKLETAIALHFDNMLEDVEDIPKPHTLTTFVSLVMLITLLM